MRFYIRKRRRPPAVIIVALIDILIVLLIFLMVTTTFKQQPALKLALPESSQAARRPAPMKTPPLVVSIDPKGNLRLGPTPGPSPSRRLKEELLAAVAKSPGSQARHQRRKSAPFGQIVKVMDAAKEAQIKTVSAFTKEASQP